jgi:hypothetical protein
MRRTTRPRCSRPRHRAARHGRTARSGNRSSYSARSNTAGTRRLARPCSRGRHRTRVGRRTRHRRDPRQRLCTSDRSWLHHRPHRSHRRPHRSRCAAARSPAFTARIDRPQVALAFRTACHRRARVELASVGLVIIIVGRAAATRWVRLAIGRSAGAAAGPTLAIQAPFFASDQAQREHAILRGAPRARHDASSKPVQPSAYSSARRCT